VSAAVIAAGLAVGQSRLAALQPPPVASLVSIVLGTAGLHLHLNRRALPARCLLAAASW